MFGLLNGQFVSAIDSSSPLRCRNICRSAPHLQLQHPSNSMKYINLCYFCTKWQIRKVLFIDFVHSSLTEYTRTYEINICAQRLYLFLLLWHVRFDVYDSTTVFGGVTSQAHNKTEQCQSLPSERRRNSTNFEEWRTGLFDAAATYFVCAQSFVVPYNFCPVCWQIFPLTKVSRWFINIFLGVAHDGGRIIVAIAPLLSFPDVCIFSHDEWNEQALMQITPRAPLWSGRDNTIYVYF